jgi:hypothetical protein
MSLLWSEDGPQHPGESSMSVPSLACRDFSRQHLKVEEPLPQSRQAKAAFAKVTVNGFDTTGFTPVESQFFTTMWPL